MAALPSRVALLAEGVDRNITVLGGQNDGNVVALLAEGVDRNIFLVVNLLHILTVALLAEGVDRNPETYRYVAGYVTSPSSRRAWIYTVIVLIRDLLSATPAVYR